MQQSYRSALMMSSHCTEVRLSMMYKPASFQINISNNQSFGLCVALQQALTMSTMYVEVCSFLDSALCRHVYLSISIKICIFLQCLPSNHCDGYLKTANWPRCSRSLGLISMGAWEMLWVGLLEWIIKDKLVFEALQANNSRKGQPVALLVLRETQIDSHLLQHAWESADLRGRSGWMASARPHFNRWRLRQNGSEATGSHVPPPNLLLPIPVPQWFYLTLHSVFSGLPLHASGPQIGTEINLATASQVRLKTLMGMGMKKKAGRERGSERDRERLMQLLGKGQLVTRDIL